LLTEAERAALDAFGAACGSPRAGTPAQSGVAALPALAALLRQRCGVTLETDPEIVAGFVRQLQSARHGPSREPPRLGP